MYIWFKYNFLKHCHTESILLTLDCFHIHVDSCKISHVVFWYTLYIHIFYLVFFLSRVLHITLPNFRDFLSCSASFLSCSASLTKTILSFIPILWSTSGLALPAWSCMRTHILHSLMSLTFLKSQAPVRLTFMWYLPRVSWKIIYGLSFNTVFLTAADLHH